MRHVLMTLAVFGMLLGFTTSSAFAGQLFPPYSLQSNPNQSCPNGKVLSWQQIQIGATTDTVVDCVDPSLGVSVISCAPGQILTGVSKGQALCMQPVYTVRYADHSVKGACGLNSVVLCDPSETAVSGGMYGGGGDALQNSKPYMVNGAPQGWDIQVLDPSGCSINNWTADGTANYDSPPQFPTGDGTSHMSGAAVVTCLSYQAVGSNESLNVAPK